METSPYSHSYSRLSSDGTTEVSVQPSCVDTSSTPRLMNLVSAGKLDPLVFVTHRFPLEEAEQAYDAFSAAQETGAFKVVLEGAKHQQLVPVGAAAGWGEDAS